MSRLDQVMREKKDVQKKPKKERKIPVYDSGGNVITPEKKRREKRLTSFLFILAFVLGLLYIPGIFMGNKNNEQRTIVEIDDKAIKKSNDYLKNHPEEDFDHDGIINSDELQKGMNPWGIDTDGDCLTDPCEISYSKTDPLIADSEILINAQKKLDKEKGKRLASPLKVGNVLLYASDYTSKAMGSVIETPYGYRFCGFNGHAVFPKEDGNYAYRIQNGYHELLPYREKEKVWKIESGDEVELYEKPLEETIEFSVFGKVFYGPSNLGTDILARILPAKGILTANKKMKIDTQPDTSDYVTAEIDTPIFKEDSDFRFGKNNNSLNDLLYVRESVKKGICIAVSLYNKEEGEYVGVIYGYDAKGNFLLADPDSLKPVGTLKIKETAYKMMNENGEIVSISYFDFGGIFYRNSQSKLQEFNSANFDHISFFAASTGDGSGSRLMDDYLKDSIIEEPEEEKVGNDALLEELKKQEEEAGTEETVPEATTQAPEATTAAPEEVTTQEEEASDSELVNVPGR